MPWLTKKADLEENRAQIIDDLTNIKSGEFPDAKEEIENSLKFDGYFEPGYAATFTALGDYYTLIISEDEAERIATDQVRQNLENEPETFSPAFIEAHIDIDRLKTDLGYDIQNSNEEDLWEQWKEDPMEFLTRFDEVSGIVKVIENLPANQKALTQIINSVNNEIIANILVEKLEELDGDTDPYVKAEVVKALEYINSFNPDDDIPKWAQQQADDTLEDPIAWLQEIHGEEEGLKEAIRIGGVNVEEAAKDAVSMDGWAHFLSNYDSNYETTDHGYVYFRE